MPDWMKPYRKALERLFDMMLDDDSEWDSFLRNMRAIFPKPEYSDDLEAMLRRTGALS